MYMYEDTHAMLGLFLMLDSDLNWLKLQELRSCANENLLHK